jgi:hypothetical protein
LGEVNTPILNWLSRKTVRVNVEKPKEFIVADAVVIEPVSYKENPNNRENREIVPENDDDSIT